MSWKKPMFDVDKLVDLYNALKVYAIYNDSCWIFDAFEAFDPRVAEMHMENILILLNNHGRRPWETYDILRRYVDYARQVYGGMDRGELVKVIKVEVDKAIAWFLNYLRERGWTEEYVKEKEARLQEQRQKLIDLLDCGLRCGVELSLFASIIDTMEVEAERETGNRCWQWWQYPKPEHGIIPWKEVKVEESIG
jgi:hypothetical protein